MRTLFTVFTSLLAAMLSTAAAQTATEAPVSGAEGKIAPADTVSSVIVTDLDELVVEARRGWVEDDKIVFVPDRHEKNLSNSAPDLLKSMQLPLVKVEGNSVTDRTGQNVTIFINGVRANETDLSTFWPKQAIRVEYIENPDISKYGVTGTIVNFIMHEYAAGGIAKLDLFQKYPLYGIYNVSSKLEYKRMTFGLLLDFTTQNIHMERTEGYEQYHDFFYKGEGYQQLSHKLFSSSEQKSNDFTLTANARYYTQSFQATHTVALVWSHNPGTMSTSSDLWTPNIFNTSSSSSFAKSHGLSPQISGNYFWKIRPGLGITGDWLYQHAKNDDYSRYFLDDKPEFENGIKETTNSVSLQLTPFFVSLSGKWGSSLTLSSSFDWHDLSYTGTADIKSTQYRNEISAQLRFWWRPAVSFNVTLIPGISSSYWHLENSEPTKSIRPMFNASANWSPSDRFNLSASVIYHLNTPEAGETNSVMLKESELLWRRGNDKLKNEESWSTYLYAYWNLSNHLSISGGTGYSRSINEPILYYEAADRNRGGVIRTLINGTPNNVWSINCAVNGSFLNNKLNFAVSPSWHYAFSDDSSLHSLHSVMASASASYRVRNCRFSLDYSSPGKLLSDAGRAIIKFRDRMNFRFTYGNGNIYVSAEVRNIFHKYRLRTIDLKSGIYSSLINQYGVGREFVVAFTYTLPFGKKTSDDIEITEGTKGKSSITFKSPTSL